MAALYPVMLHLDGRVCVIVGAGAVAARKITRLIESGAHITVIAPVLHPALARLAGAGTITVRQTVYVPGMLAELNPVLVFAATDDPAANRQVVTEAQALGVLVNAADEQGERDFMDMAVVQRGDITIALSLGGAAPALAAHLRQVIEQAVGSEYATLAGWMAQARPLVQAALLTQPERAALWHRLVESSILDKLRQGDESGARQHFDQIMHEALNPFS